MIIVKHETKLIYLLLFFFTMAQQPKWAKAPSLSRSHDHTQTHLTW